MKRIITLSLVTVVVVSLILIYSPDLPGGDAPAIPADIFHSYVIANAGCFTCHTPGKQMPLREGHPPRTDCLVCHKSRHLR